MTDWIRTLAIVASVTATIGCDRMSKEVATRQLAGVPRRSFLGDTFRLEYVLNRGGFLSLGSGLPDAARTALLTGTTSVLLVLLSVVLVRRRLGGGWDTVGLGLVWAGGVSNLVDRLVRGQVVDFLNFGIGPVRTGIFNVADVAITCGCALVLLAQYGSRSGIRGR